MSTTTVKPPAGLGIAPSASAVPQGAPQKNIKAQWTEGFDLPGGQVRTVGFRIGTDDDPQAEEKYAEVLRQVDVCGYVVPYEREVSQLQDRYNDLTGYDRQGQPQYRVQGRDRDVLEMKLANAQRRLADAQRTVKEAQALQQAERQAEVDKHVRIQVAAEKRAVEIAEEEAIERQALLIVRRNGGR